MSNRKGYDANFLNTKVSVPVLSNSNDAFILNDSEVINYTHFSLALSEKRKFAIWVAWNVDGGKLRKVKRIDFYEDDRIPEKNQAGENLYAGNPLDRGHIARRADLAWGSSYDEALEANNDSFAFTNIAPQMDSFNQGKKGGVWGKLEDSLFEQIKVDESKVSVIAGCIFNESDKIYRKNYKIPTEFFKTILYEENQKLKTKSFILTQDLTGLKFLDLEEYKTYEVNPTEIEKKCFFKFDSVIHKASSFNFIEGFIERQPINDINQMNW